MREKQITSRGISSGRRSARPPELWRSSGGVSLSFNWPRENTSRWISSGRPSARSPELLRSSGGCPLTSDRPRENTSRGISSGRRSASPPECRGSSGRIPLGSTGPFDPRINTGWFTVKCGESMANWHSKCRKFNEEVEFDTCLKSRRFTCAREANYLAKYRSSWI